MDKSKLKFNIEDVRNQLEDDRLTANILIQSQVLNNEDSGEDSDFYQRHQKIIDGNVYNKHDIYITDLPKTVSVEDIIARQEVIIRLYETFEMLDELIERVKKVPNMDIKYFSIVYNFRSREYRSIEELLNTMYEFSGDISNYTLRIKYLLPTMIDYQSFSVTIDNVNNYFSARCGKVFGVSTSISKNYKLQNKKTFKDKDEKISYDNIIADREVYQLCDTCYKLKEVCERFL